MGASEITVGELLYEAAVDFTDVVEYGVSLGALLAGNIAVPPAGARFDISFRGSLRGSKLSGTVTGVDYLYMRADGRAQLHIHAKITTEDGQAIAFFADGVALPQEGTSVFQLRENVSFITASPDYAWLNQLQGWGLGTVDPVKARSRSKRMPPNRALEPSRPRSVPTCRRARFGLSFAQHCGAARSP